MTEPISSSSSSSPSSGEMTIDIRPMIEDISQVMSKHITHILNGVIGEYTIYKETHDTVMGLPCVRKLQDRIAELEQGHPASAPTNNAAAANSHENEIAQLQSAIAEMNRYIIALESKVGSGGEKDEESVKLEIHEDDNSAFEGCAAASFSMSSTHKNVIITSSSSVDGVALDVVEEENEDAEEYAEEDTEEEEEEEAVEDIAAEEEEEAAEEEEAEEEEEEEEADEEEAVEDAAEEATAEAAEEEEEAEEATAEAAEEEEEAEEATAEAAEEEEEEEEAVEEAAEEATAEAVDEEEAEEATAEAVEEEEEAAEEAVEEAVEEAEEEAEEEEAEIEVSEVKIKGKTYFTTDPQNGIIYACVNDDVGDEVGVFKNGVAVFNKGKK